MSNEKIQTVSDIRDSQQNTLTEKSPKMSQPQTASSSNSNNNQSYLSAAKASPQSPTPSKEQAIIIHAAEQLKLFDYVKSLSDIIGPKNITYASKISNNRICIYLSSTQVVDSLLKTHDKITIDNTELSIRRLINPAKRIILSNVSPDIPNGIVENALKDIGLQLASPVTHLRAGFPGEEFGHILSFRRQVYVSPPQDSILEFESSILINYEDNSRRIFLSTDTMECFLCKQEGHIAINCPQTNQVFPTLEETSGSQNKRSAPTSSPAISENNSIENNPRNTIIQSDSTAEFNFTTPSQPPIRNPNSQGKPPKKKLKIPEADSQPNPPTQYNTIEEIFTESPLELTISYKNFKSFIENCRGNNDPLTEARRYTNDMKSLLDTIKYVYTKLNDRTLRNRFTRISKKIKKQLEEEGVETESLVSLSSQLSQSDNESANYTQDKPQEFY